MMVEKECNIYHIKPISPAEAFTTVFEEFTNCMKGDNTHLSTKSSMQRQPHYNLQSTHQHQHKYSEESIHLPTGPPDNKKVKVI